MQGLSVVIYPHTTPLHSPPHLHTHTHTHAATSSSPFFPPTSFSPSPPGLSSRHPGSSQASLCEGTLQLHQEDSQRANSEEGRHPHSVKFIKQGTALCMHHCSLVRGYVGKVSTPLYVSLEHSIVSLTGLVEGGAEWEAGVCSCSIRPQS